MKRRGKRRREKKEREKKKRGREKRREKKKEGEEKKMLHREPNPRLSAWQVKALTISYRRRLVRHVQLY